MRHRGQCCRAVVFIRYVAPRRARGFAGKNSDLSGGFAMLTPTRSRHLYPNGGIGPHPYCHSFVGHISVARRPCSRRDFDLVPECALVSFQQSISSSSGSPGVIQAKSRRSARHHRDIVVRAAKARPAIATATLVGCCPLRPPPGRAVSALTAAMETHHSPLHGIVGPAARQDSLLRRLGCLLCATWLFIVRDVLARKLTDKQ